MAQIIPPITSLPIDSSAAPSVEDIQDRLPSICVDYLSHDWSEEDVWASWRNMTRHKHEIANGVRLENASWRTWQKQRNNLKTISPETLNWLKDSDVTWLYGPLHTATVEPVRPLKVSTAGERLGLDVGPRPSKPILKHRTLSEMLSITTPSSPVMEADTPDGAVDGMEGARPMLSQTKSDTNIFTTRPGMTIRRTSPTLPQGTFPGTGTGQAGQKSPNAPGTRTPIEGAPPSGKEKKHISFNTFVEQCIAVDDPTENQQNTFEDGDDSDDMLEMRSHRSSSSKSSRPSFSRHSSSSSTRSSNEPLTIAKIAPTMLKTQTYANSDQLPQMVYQPPPQYLSPERETVSVSPGMHSPVGPASWTSQSSTTSTGSAGSAGTAGTATGRKWDDDDGQPYDYFGGPDHSGKSSSSSSSSVSTAQGQSPAQNIPHRAPTVGQPPSQPKWRQANQGAQVGSSVESSVSASSSSSSTSLNNATSPSPPQPARSILKTRPASSEVPMEPESSSPPSSYFNYNPSAATGIGGMRGAQYLDHGPGGSPLVSPATASTAAASGNTSGSASGGEERGRSTSRGGTGTSQYDRSISRGTTSSTGSASSLSGSSGGGGAAGNGQGPMSPGTSRSPVGVHTARKAPAQSQVQGQAQGQRSQSQQQAQKPAQAQQAQTQDDGMEIDHDESPDRGASTPTPHSSPQITFRPLKDTSPASLPHHSTSLSTPPALYPSPPSSSTSTPGAPLSPYASRNPSSPVASHLPRPDPAEPSSTSPPPGPPLGGDGKRQNQRMGGKATTAAIGTMAAAPHIHQNQPAAGAAPQGQAQISTGPTSGQGSGLAIAPRQSGQSGPGGQAQEQAQRTLEQMPSTSAGLGQGVNAPSANEPITQPHASTQQQGPGGPMNRYVRPSHTTTGAPITSGYPDHLPRGDDDDEGDGSSIMGRAANIASTARDLFGALWYGGNSTTAAAPGSGHGVTQGRPYLPATAATGQDQGQGVGTDRRQEQQAMDQRVAEQSARRGGRHTRGKSIG